MKKWLARLVFFGVLPVFAVAGSWAILEMVHLSSYDVNLRAYDARHFLHMLVMGGSVAGFCWLGMFFSRALLPEWWELIDPKQQFSVALKSDGNGWKRLLAYIAMIVAGAGSIFTAGWVVWGSGVVIKPHGAGLELVLAMFLFIAAMSLLIRLVFYCLGRVWPQWESLLGGSARPKT